MNKNILVTIGTISEYFIYFFLIGIFFIILSPRLPTKNLFQTFVVPTGSMVPTVSVGSVAFVNSQNISPEVGDTIAFASPSDKTITILHRVVEKKSDGLVTKGDNNSVVDNWIVPVSNVKGTYMFGIPYLGYIVTFVKTPLGFMTMAVIPALLLMFASALQIKEGISEEVDRRKRKIHSHILGTALVAFTVGFLLSQIEVKSALAQWNAQASLLSISIVTTSSPTPQPTVSPSPSPTPSPTPTNTPTPSPSPSGSPGPCYNLNIVIEGNGAGSHNSIHIVCTRNTIIMQFNNVLGLSTVHYESTYDSQQGFQGVTGFIPFDGELNFRREVYLGSCSSDGCVDHTLVRNRRLKLKLSKSD